MATQEPITSVVSIKPTEKAYYVLPTAKLATQCNQTNPIICDRFDWNSHMVNEGPHGETLLAMTTTGVCILTGEPCLKMAEILIATLSGADSRTVEHSILGAQG